MTPHSCEKNDSRQLQAPPSLTAHWPSSARTSPPVPAQTPVTVEEFMVQRGGGRGAEWLTDISARGGADGVTVAPLGYVAWALSTRDQRAEILRRWGVSYESFFNPPGAR